MPDKRVEIEIVTTGDVTGAEKVDRAIKGTTSSTDVESSKKLAKTVTDSIEPVKTLDREWKKTTADAKEGADHASESTGRWASAIHRASEAFPPLRLALLFLHPVTAAITLLAGAFVYVKNRLEEFIQAIQVTKFVSLQQAFEAQAIALRQAAHEAETFERSLLGVINQSAKMASINDKIVSALQQRSTLDDKIDAAEKARALAGVDRLEKAGLDPIKAALLRDRIEEQFAQKAIDRARNVREATINQRKLEIAQQGALLEELRNQLEEHEKIMAGIQRPELLNEAINNAKENIKNTLEEIQRLDAELKRVDLLPGPRGAIEKQRGERMAFKDQQKAELTSLTSQQFAREEEFNLAKEKQDRLRSQTTETAARRKTLQAGLSDYLLTSGAELDNQSALLGIGRQTRGLLLPEAPPRSPFAGTLGRTTEFSGTRDGSAEQALTQSLEENKRLTDAMLSFGQTTLETQQVTVQKILQLESQIRNTRPTQ